MPFKIPFRSEFKSADFAPDDDSEVVIVRADDDNEDEKERGKLKEYRYASLKAFQASTDFGKTLKMANAGEIFSVNYKITVFIDTPNKNFSRPTPGKLNSVLRRTGKSTPMMRDHGKNSTNDDGVISNFKASTAKGKPAIDADAALKDAGQQVKFLKGGLTNYSAGMESKSVKCSICSKKYNKYGSSYFYPSCDHRPGMSYDGKACEAHLSGASIVEVSSVTFSAVEGAKSKTTSFSEGDGNMDLEQALAKIKELEVQLSEKNKLATEYSAKNEQLKAASAAVFNDAREIVLDQLVKGGNITEADKKDDGIIASFSSMGLKSAYNFLSRSRVDPKFSSEIKSNSDVPDPLQKGKDGETGTVLGFYQTLGIL